MGKVTSSWQDKKENFLRDFVSGDAGESSTRQQLRGLGLRYQQIEDEMQICAMIKARRSEALMAKEDVAWSHGLISCAAGLHSAQSKAKLKRELAFVARRAQRRRNFKFLTLTFLLGLAIGFSAGLL